MKLFFKIIVNIFMCQNILFAQKTIDVPFEEYLYNTDSLVLKYKIKSFQQVVLNGRYGTKYLAETFYDRQGRPIKQIDFQYGNLKDTLMLKLNNYEYSLLSETVIILYPNNAWNHLDYWDYCRLDHKSIEKTIGKKVKKIYKYSFKNDTLYMARKCFCDNDTLNENTYTRFLPGDKSNIELSNWYYIDDAITMQNTNLMDYKQTKNMLPKLKIDSSLAKIKTQKLKSNSYLEDYVVTSKFDSSDYVIFNYADSNKLKSINLYDKFKWRFFYSKYKFSSCIRYLEDSVYGLQFTHLEYDALNRKFYGIYLTEQGELFYIYYEYHKDTYKKKFFKFNGEKLVISRIEEIYNDGPIKQILYFNDSKMDKIYGKPKKNKPIELIYNYTFYE